MLGRIPGVASIFLMNKETKICKSCGRVITWRKKWENCWAEVKYCSAGCREKKVSTEGNELEKAILDLLSKRSRNSTICPSEVARGFFPEEEWRGKMEEVRRAARRLVAGGQIEFLQKGLVVDPSTAKGPIRLRKS